MSQLISTPRVVKSRKVRVALRCRPVLGPEMSDFATVKVHASSGKASVEIKKLRVTKRFQFDFAFGAAASNEEVYEKIGRPIIDDVISGNNGAIIAYGQTGTGKSYTMGILERANSKRKQQGVIPTALEQVSKA